ncbi:MAG: FUSC family protein [Acidobacteriota bacterium]|nr:FUSC family protein [Acidobacteriota bacterium]
MISPAGPRGTERRTGATPPARGRASTTRSVLREAFRFESGLVAPVVGLVTALPVVAVFVVGLAAFSPREAVSMAVGADLLAIASLVGAPRLSLPLAALDAVGMAAAVVIGVATTSATWLHVLLLVPLCAGAGFLTVFGITQGVIGTQAIIAYVVLGRFAGSFTTALHLGLLVLVGALVEVSALLVLRLPPSLRFQRLQLAGAVDAVAELVRSDPRRSATEVLTAVDDAERSLAAPSLFGRPDSRILVSILNQLRRARLEVTTLSGLRVRLADRGAGDAAAAIEPCVGEVARCLDELGAALRRRPGSWRDATATFHADLGRAAAIEPVGGDEVAVLVRQCVDHLRALDGQLRAMGGLVEDLGGEDTRHAWRGRLPSLSGVSAEDRTDLSLARENLTLTSPGMRHAIRLGVAVPASTLLAAWWDLPRGYWVPFAVAVILKPDYSTLLRRGVGRVLGTAVGASLAAVLVTTLHPGTALASVIVAGLAWATYATWSASFAVAVGFVTALVLVLVSVGQSNPVTTALDRLADVAIGGAISLAVYLIWPTSPHAGVSDAFDSLFSSLGGYLDAVAPLVQGAPPDQAALVEWSRRGRTAWARAEAAVGRSVEEPTSTRVDPTLGRGLLAVSMRVLRAIHALRIEAERGATASSGHLAATLAGSRGALEVLARHFRDGFPARWEGLRPAYRSTEDELSSLGAPPTIAVHLDELVNALNTAEHLIAEARA